MSNLISCRFTFFLIYWSECFFKGVSRLNQQSIQDFIIQKYQDEEKTMVHLFVEWCRAHEYDPHTIYHTAYPEQGENPILSEIYKELQDQKPLHIQTDTLLNVLQIFGNDELAFVITELIEKYK